MVNVIRQSNQNSLSDPALDDSGGVDLFLNREDSSTESNIMTNNMNLDILVEETLQGFANTTEEPIQTAELTDSFNDQLIAENTMSDEPITGVEMISTATPLNFSDYETGSLDSGDQTDQGRYIDQYSLTGFEDKQTITLDLRIFQYSAINQWKYRRHS